MKTKSNVLILGAGASMDYGFPSGAKLKELAIGALTPGSSPELAILLAVGDKMGFTAEDIRNFKTDLENSELDRSIDAFIEAQSDRKDILEKYVKIAKSLIAILVIQAEDTKNIQLGEGWYAKLFEKMYEDRRTYDSFMTNRIGFVTFNYDRSLEYYLAEAVKKQFRKTEVDTEEIGSVLSTHFPVVHVHGSIGTLWPSDEQGKFVAYDGDWKKADAVIASANNIKLITDDIDGEFDRDFVEARSMIEGADTVHFIGFGFHRNNMSRLGFDSPSSLVKPHKFFGTVKGLAEQKITECETEYLLTTTSYVSSGKFNLSTSVNVGHTAADYLDIGPFH